MSTKYALNKNKYVSIIIILSIVTVTLSILYFNELKNNANENLEKLSMYMYELEVKRPLVGILFFLGLQSDESIDWQEKEFRKALQSIFRDVDEGL